MAIDDEQVSGNKLQTRKKEIYPTMHKSKQNYIFQQATFKKNQPKEHHREATSHQQNHPNPNPTTITQHTPKNLKLLSGNGYLKPKKSQSTISIWPAGALGCASLWAGVVSRQYKRREKCTNMYTLLFRYVTFCPLVTCTLHIFLLSLSLAWGLVFLSGSFIFKKKRGKFVGFFLRPV
jgi:hypothetical protein